MPKGARHSRRGSATAVLDNPTPVEETPVMTSVDTTPDVDETEDDSVQFDLSMEPAPDDYQPERKVPGRQRRPSFFDDRLRAADVYEQGWQRVPATSEEHKAYIVRELNRAKLHLNNPKGGMNEGDDEIGLDLDDKQDDAIYFKSRKAQKRERKATAGSDALSENASEDGVVDPAGDNDE